jgi:hypothetical protein
MEEAAMDVIRARDTGGPPAFDPVCGTVLWEETVDRFFDGARLHVFCCAMCRRIYIDEREKLRNAGEERSATRTGF